MKWMLAACCSLAFAAAHASDEHVGYDAERGDPARWYEPITTPQQRYENALKETRNALAEAVKECRAQREGRKACEAQARAEAQREREDAKRQLDAARSPTG